MVKGIVIGAGPSLFKYKHLEVLAKSNFKGYLLITDRMLKPCIAAGVTPDKFPNYYVFTVEDMWKLEEFLSNVRNCNKINLVHSERTKKTLLEDLQKQGYNIRCDYWPYLSVTDNVGLMAFHYAYRRLGIDEIIMIGMDHSDERTPVFNENTDCYNEYYKNVKGFHLDQLKQLWYDGFMDLLELVPGHVNIYNCTGGGILEHYKIHWKPFGDMLNGKS